MKILVIGISVRAMVESAVGSQYSVAALDAFGDQDLRALAESRSLRRDFGVPYSPNALYQACRKLCFEAVAYTSNLENHPGVLDRFSRNCRLVGNSPQSVRAVRHWPRLFSRLRQAGFSVPETIFGVTDKPDPNQRWLLKPILSGGGHGISFAGEKASSGNRRMLQQYVPGKPCSASFVSNGCESVLIGITEQLIGMHHFGSKGFQYCGNILPLPEAREKSTGEMILNQVRNAAEFLTREFGLTGVNGFDFILNNGRIWLTEVNPRYSASMELIEQAYGLPVFDLHVQSVLNGRLPEFRLESLLNNAKFFGKSILFCERNTTAPEIPDWRNQCIKDIPAPGEQLREGSPICTILASRSRYDETLGDLQLKASALKEEFYE
jgi:predicted ATP-grasp superfamily ATP-dependent carboligase